MSEIPFVKYPEIPYLTTLKMFTGKTYLFEKMDGSNCQVRNINWRIHPGSRSKDISHGMWDNLDFGEKFWMKDFKKWAMGNSSLYNLPERYVVFGEWIHGESPVNLPGEKVMYPESIKNNFIFIDLGVLNSSGSLIYFEDYETALKEIHSLGIEGILPAPYKIVNNLHAENLERIVNEGIEGKLAIGEMEGVVLKDYSIKEIPPKFQKYLAKPYSEQDDRKSKESGAAYITLPRARKAFLRLLDSGMAEKHIGIDSLTAEIVADIQKEGNIKVKQSLARGLANQFLRKYEANKTVHGDKILE
jgi:hypothetical protein